MAFDWKKYRDGLEGESEWDDAEDLGRLSMESFFAKHSPLRRDISSGQLRLSGPGVTGNTAPIDGVSAALRNFQRLVLATGMSLAGHKSLQGPAPADVVTKTLLNLDGSPLPGSLVLNMTPAMSPAEEIAPTGQRNMFGDPDTQAIDFAVKDALALLEEGRRFGADSDKSDFLERLKDSGPRVASALRDFTESLADFEFEPSLSWQQPRHPRIKTSLVVSELAIIRDAIESNELEVEPTTIRGILRTVSEIKAWQIEIGHKQLVSINARHIPVSETSTLRTGMHITVNVRVMLKSGPASNPTTEYIATSFTVDGSETPQQ
jgi:hypothetical protein